ncbi:peptidoglycan-binding protein [uncultured Pelagimonas sp.]|uniref:peptidoglycan-binding domain-containing protein n=1 Tax=uncultured Pelagimonas sp. TaxID=1618102 RepID=UPI0026229DC6|nr:peptidoglycan-binding protein [uncultured Pelagimonas sp.]
MRNSFIPFLTALLTTTGVAQAAGDALVIGNSQYDTIQTLFGADRMDVAAEALRNKGLDVTELQDASSDEMRIGFADFLKELDETDSPVVILLAGAIVHGAAGAYLLPVGDQDGATPAQVLTRAFPIDAALTVLGQYPGRGFLVIGETPVDIDLGSYLTPGAGRLDLPSGVTAIRGSASDIVSFASKELTNADTPILTAANDYGLDVSGYIPRDLVLLRETEVVAPVAPPKPKVDPDADVAAWENAQRLDNAKGYQAYLDSFAEGAFASAAKQRLKAIETEPFYKQRRAEESLGLNRDERRKIQRDLTILDFNPRGIDGIFGPGSRKAIGRWQESVGEAPSTYITRPQIERLAGAAGKRAEELEAEAIKRRVTQDKADHALWSKVMDQGTEVSIRQYLTKYPDGLHAAEARKLLRVIEKQRGGGAAAADQRAWNDAREADTVAALNRYLKDRPGGAFAAEAKARISELQRNAKLERDRQAALSEEQALGLNSVARKLAESRLANLKMNPGPVDGKFDKRTRDAIRRYQKAHSLRVSGFLDEQTVVQLLAGTLLGR